ncbi:DUF1156 domain-containing protein [Aliiroseovarius sp. S253]|uniref:DUF1156 domain-containing protein n=1 Tax=Aliiroseovarius sp. S253 TaxID=3415133 RepID=UPI003C7B1271
MTEPYKKKLIEVAIPLEAINAASAREKSIRHGHPSTLHLWWARRPLAACRAVLFAQLVDDPSSHPDKFTTHEDQEAERNRLFQIIEDLVKWENSTNDEVLERARVEIRKSCGGELPPIYDPFSGGGSIPLEAQRLGLPAYGSDLNPVAVMIGKAMIEIPPMFKDLDPIHSGLKNLNHYRNTEGLAEDVKFYGQWMRDRALESIGHLYPEVDLPEEFGGGKASAIAWIWSRTVPSPDPAFSDVQVPIASSFLLGSKKGKEASIVPIVDKQSKTITYKIRYGGTPEDIRLAKNGTKAGRGSFRCLISGAAITTDYVKEVAINGKLGQELIAIVAQGKGRRIYVQPSNQHSGTAQSPMLHETAEDFRQHFLTGETPARLTGGTCHGYGLDTWGKLFTDRQIVSLKTFVELLDDLRDRVEADALNTGLFREQGRLQDGVFSARAYAEAISIYLAFAINRSVDRGSTICTWDSSPKMEALRNTFGRQALPMTWDFAEGNPFSSASGNFLNNVEWVQKSIQRFVPASNGVEIQHDAQTLTYPENVVISSDPPYYDNIGYADLSDFFFCWMKPELKSVFPRIFGILATPKDEELVATAFRHGGRERAEEFFLNGMSSAILNMATQSSDDFPATIYYAFKQSEIDQEGISSTGWATFLQAVVEAGFAVVGTWPLRTEMANRMVASGTNALANSVVLVCRKREVAAEVITRAEFVRALRRELPPAIEELQEANISPADMPQSAIGPGMGVFSRYKAVLEADDSHMSVKTALQLINRELSEYLDGVIGDFDADTGFAIKWFELFGMGKGDYGTANNIAMARGIAVESVKHAGIVESAAGEVRILKREEMDPDWEPETDSHLTIWECCQYLIRSLENDGSYAAAELLKRIGSEKAEAVKDLAYCLYDISANKRQDAAEARSYNALIADWTELTRQAATINYVGKDRQMRFEV